MGRRVAEAAIVSALVIGALGSGLWREHGGPIMLGIVLAACAAGIAWISLAFEALGRARHAHEPADLDVVDSFPFANLFPAVFLALFGGAFVVASGTQKDGTAALLGVGLAVSTVAVIVATRRDGVRIDIAKRRAVHWRGCRFPWRTYPMLADTSTIPADASLELSTAYYGKGKPHLRYVVTLRPGPLLRKTGNVDTARLAAEQAAKALAIDLVDHIGTDDAGNPIERKRSAAELDVPLTEQLRRRGVLANRRELPAKTKLVLVSQETPWLVRIPPLGLRAGDILAMVFFTPFLCLFMTLPAAIVSAVATGDMRLFLPMLALFGIIASWFGLLRLILRARRETQHIELSPTKIRVMRRAPDLVRNFELSADRIEEIAIEPDREQYHDGLCVVVRGDGVSVTFGHQLSREDALWLRDATLAALAPRSIYR